MTDLDIRPALAADLPAIVAMLADDHLGRGREDTALPLSRSYLDAFAAMEANPHQHLMVAVEGESVVGTFELLFIPGLSRKGAWKGQIEAVRVAADRRGQGLGEQMIGWAVEQCRQHGCATVQLTTHESRVDAHRFYARLGFKPSHLGFKLDLPGPGPQ